MGDLHHKLGRGLVDVRGAEGDNRRKPYSHQEYRKDDPFSLPQDPEVIPQIDLVVV